MKYWITTDTHFGHSKMFEIGRPQNYEAQILAGLTRILESDLLIHLGDVCIGKDELNHDLYIKPIKARKILVRGNHDKKSDTWYLEHGWDFVCDSFTLTKFGKEILFTHIPVLVKGNWDINLHGHIHEGIHRGYVPQEFHKVVSLEMQGYLPQNLEKIVC